VRLIAELAGLDLTVLAAADRLIQQARRAGGTAAAARLKDFAQIRL
jgi:hypothetical protein